MSIVSTRSPLGLVEPATRQRRWRIPLLPFLALTLPTMIVIGNFVIGVRTPTTLGAEDELMLIDPVWRLVQGQNFGTDFHHPLGFGLFEVAAILWRLLGSHFYVLRASAAIFALVISVCGSVVAIRQLRHAAGLAALFCVTVAFIASGPSIYGIDWEFGITLTYDRLLVSGLLVLFVQSFANDLDTRRERGYIDYFVTALLLNVLFLIKISGLILGLLTVVIGSILRGPSWKNLRESLVVFIILVVMLTVDFIITGISVSAIIHDYSMAARGRVGSVSPHDILWFARRLPVLGAVVLLALYVVSWPSREGNENQLLRGLFIIGFFWACQVVLNMSNTGTAADLIILASAAAVSIVTWTDTWTAGSFWDRVWRILDPRRLHEISVRQLMPLVIFAIVLAPEVMGALRAAKLDLAISFGTKQSITVAANKGVALRVLENSPASSLVPYLNHAIHAIEGLGLTDKTIANLDFMNPFPAFFLAPAPKNVQVMWAFDATRVVPVGYSPGWAEIIGDACIVTQPKHSPIPPAASSEPLIAAVAPHLAMAFTPVYEDELWKIWRRRDGCSARSG